MEQARKHALITSQAFNTPEEAAEEFFTDAGRLVDELPKCGWDVAGFNFVVEYSETDGGATLAAIQRHSANLDVPVNIIANTTRRGNTENRQTNEQSSRDARVRLGLPDTTLHVNLDFGNEMSPDKVRHMIEKGLRGHHAVVGSAIYSPEMLALDEMFMFPFAGWLQGLYAGSKMNFTVQSPGGCAIPIWLLDLLPAVLEQYAAFYNEKWHEPFAIYGYPGLEYALMRIAAEQAGIKDYSLGLVLWGAEGKAPDDSGPRRERRLIQTDQFLRNQATLGAFRKELGLPTVWEDRPAA